MLGMWTRILGYERIARFGLRQYSFNNKVTHLVKKILYVEPKFIIAFTLLCTSSI